MATATASPQATQKPGKRSGLDPRGVAADRLQATAVGGRSEGTANAILDQLDRGPAEGRRYSAANRAEDRAA